MPLFIKYKLKLSKYIDKLLTILFGNRKNYNTQSHDYKTIDDRPSVSPISNATTKVDDKLKQITSNVDKESKEAQDDITKRIDYPPSTKPSKFDRAMSSNGEKQSERSDVMKQISEQPTQIFVGKSEEVLPKLDNASSISKDKTQILVNDNPSISKDKKLTSNENVTSLSKQRTQILIDDNTSISKQKTQTY